MAKDKDAWIKFFPTDWRGDTNLQLCSIAARGLWIEMIAIMHTCEPYGHLTKNGAEMHVKDLALLVRLGVAECVTLLEQLESAGVFSRTDRGVIFSRRMVRDKALRIVRSEAGKVGGLRSYGSRFAQANAQAGCASKLSRPRARALASGFLASGSLDSGSLLPEGVQGKPTAVADRPKARGRKSADLPVEAVNLRDVWNEHVRRANGFNADDTGAEAVRWMVRRNRDGLSWDDMERAVMNYAQQVRIDLAGGLPRPVALRNFWGEQFRAEAYLDAEWKPCNRARAAPGVFESDRSIGTPNEMLPAEGF